MSGRQAGVGSQSPWYAGRSARNSWTPATPGQALGRAEQDQQARGVATSFQAVAQCCPHRAGAGALGEALATPTAGRRPGRPGPVNYRRAVSPLRPATGQSSRSGLGSELARAVRGQLGRAAGPGVEIGVDLAQQGLDSDRAAIGAARSRPAADGRLFFDQAGDARLRVCAVPSVTACSSGWLGLGKHVTQHFARTRPGRPRWESRTAAATRLAALRASRPAKTAGGGDQPLGNNTMRRSDKDNAGLAQLAHGMRQRRLARRPCRPQGRRRRAGRGGPVPLSVRRLLASISQPPSPAGLRAGCRPPARQRRAAGSGRQRRPGPRLPAGHWQRRRRCARGLFNDACGRAGNWRSFRRPSRVFRIAVEPRKTSSRKATSASGSMPPVSVTTSPSRSLPRLTGPNSSDGSVKRPSRYSKYPPPRFWRRTSAHHGALGGARRPDDQQVLVRHGAPAPSVRPAGRARRGHGSLRGWLRAVVARQFERTGSWWSC